MSIPKISVSLTITSYTPPDTTHNFNGTVNLSGNGDVEVPQGFLPGKVQVDWTLTAGSNVGKLPTGFGFNSFGFKQQPQGPEVFDVEPVIDPRNLFTPQAWSLSPLTFSIVFDTKYWQKVGQEYQVFYYRIYFNQGGSTGGTDETPDPTMKVKTGGILPGTM